MNTLSALLSTNDDEINTSIKNNHVANLAHATASRILIPNITVIKLQSILFELKYHAKYGVLSNQLMLESLDTAQLLTMRANKKN